MEYTNDDVLRAQAFSKAAHEGQTDKAGAPYHLHPLAVSAHLTSNFEKIVALLHDTVEDTSVTLDDVSRAFGEEVARVVNILTYNEGETFSAYISRVAKDKTATRVKLADMNHNMDLLRLESPGERDLSRLVNKYIPAYISLSQALIRHSASAE